MLYAIYGPLCKHAKKSLGKTVFECTGIPRFTLLMWGHIKKNAESENRINRGYLVVLRGDRIEL